MRNLKRQSLLSCLVVSIALVPTAHAQWSVIDEPALGQLIQEVSNTEQQLATARNQLLQANLTLQSMTGNRAMGQLLGGINRNYLPMSWAQVTNVLQGASGYGALSSESQGIIATNAVLSSQRLASLSPGAQQLLQSERQWSAMQQALAHQALANASGRFATLQSLIAAITSTTDQKAILELQSRISAELGMLQNEQIKVQLLNQSALAQQSALNLQAREQAIDGHGQFNTRLQPTP